MKKPRQISEAERLDHVQTLELLAHLILQSRPMPAIYRRFVLFSCS